MLRHRTSKRICVCRLHFGGDGGTIVLVETGEKAQRALGAVRRVLGLARPYRRDEHAGVLPVEAVAGEPFGARGGLLGEVGLMAAPQAGPLAVAVSLLDSLATPESAAVATAVRAGKVKVNESFGILDACAKQMMGLAALSADDLAFIAVMISLTHTAARLGFDASWLAKLRALFDHYDVDKSGTLETNELECLLVELGRNADHSSARTLQTEFGDVARHDSKEGRSISFDAFVRLVAKLEGDAVSGGEPAPAAARPIAAMLRRFSLTLADEVDPTYGSLDQPGPKC